MLYKQREKGCSDWAKTLERHKEGILNYFDFRVTNAYTEGVHTKMKLIKRQGFGYKNKEVYMRKLMLGFLPIATIMPPHLFQ
jgi:transposase